MRRSLCLSSVLSRNMQIAKRACLFSSLTIETVASVQTSWPDAERALLLEFERLALAGPERLELLVRVLRSPSAIVSPNIVR